MRYDFIISGGGIAGLATALFLQKDGYRVKVLERTEELREVGAGLGLGPNAWKYLEKLGLTDELEKYCNHIKSTQFLDPTGKVISDMKLERIREKYGVASFTIHRAQLQKLLCSSLQPGTLELGNKVKDYLQNEEGVTVLLKDGNSFRGKALIVADGIHSSVRRKILPKVMPRYSGYTCWRAVVEVPKGSINSGIFTETWGPKGRFGIVPLSNNQIYWFATINAPFQRKEMTAFTTEDLFQHFQNYHAPIPELIQMTLEKDLVQNDILELKPIKHFAYNKVLLIGDAAHATTPNLGQGAGQAVEDAFVLSNILKSTDNIEEAFKKFERQRIPKTKKVTNLSFLLGKVAQLENPMLVYTRNLLFSTLPPIFQERQLESIYKTDFNNEKLPS